MELDSVLCIGYGLDVRRSLPRYPARARQLSLLENVEADLGALLATVFKEYRSFLSKDGKATRA
jgi:hypothetical protein